MAAMNWDHLKKIFPFPFAKNPMLLEGIVFNAAGKYSKDYSGGCWTVRNVGSLLFLVAPEGSYKVEGTDNCYSGTMDHYTYGAALTLMIFNHLLWNAADAGADEVNALSDLYYKLLRAARADKRVNASEINGFLD